MNQKTRNIGFDLLRIIAAFSVIVLHASAHTWYYLPVNGSEWFISNAFNVLSRFGVPIFVMISGSLFLAEGKEIPIKKLYTHSILRLLIVYIIWSAVYGIQSSLEAGLSSLSYTDILKKMIAGRYHLWFLPMIIGIYMLVPILRRWVHAADKQEIRYFLTLFVIFQIMLTTVRAFLKNPELLSVLDLFHAEMVCSYVGYFVLGYYLVKYPPTPQKRHILYIAFPVSYAVNLLVTNLQARREGLPAPDFFDSFGFFTFLAVIAIFVFFTKQASSEGTADPSASVKSETGVSSDGKKNRLLSLITFISESTFGIYLMHLLIMESPILLKLLNDVPVILSIPAVSMITFLISFLIASILRHIPVLGRFLC